MSTPSTTITDADVLRERAERLQMGYTERFELDAAQFYRDTGFIAPGKSVPLEMASSQPDSLRDPAWYEWSHKQSQRFIAALKAGAEALTLLRETKDEKDHSASLLPGDALASPSTTEALPEIKPRSFCNHGLHKFGTWQRDGANHVRKCRRCGSEQSR